MKNGDISFTYFIISFDSDGSYNAYQSNANEIIAFVLYSILVFVFLFVLFEFISALVAARRHARTYKKSEDDYKKYEFNVVFGQGEQIDF